MINKMQTKINHPKMHKRKRGRLLFYLLSFAILLMPACSQDLSPTLVTSPDEGINITSNPWQYVVMGDSTSWGYPEKIAKKIEKNYGVSVEIKVYTVGGQNTNNMISQLQSNNDLREDIRNADLVTFLVPTNIFSVPVRTYISDSPERCGGEDNQDCIRNALNTYNSHAEVIIKEIDALVDRKDTIVIAHDVWQFNTTLLKESSDFKVVNGYFQAFNAHVHEVCDQYGIPVADGYDAFMGEDHSRNPEKEGLIYDGFHTNDKGQDIIVDLIMEIINEYEPL